ncbi:ADP-ribosylglycohydrolase family protein [Cellulomonas sp. KH9]|uniref:ADP-ribosylglycohydrolase family protein n=1 Tax=Cellulomonas sp. KH9 TaxID=1855324 RepID=UPI0008ED11EE|nr:ADP-ribosylglycohydrolase family protein [Cellulomonas sp. KH9]SFJ64042.1 ADP-ribosylglycohydrolase [Cellulomonas sp. KH9]
MTPTLLDRATGTLLASAAGDALGAGYEFGPPLPDDQPVRMAGRRGVAGPRRRGMGRMGAGGRGGTFGWAPGEWTDDTSMAVPIAQVLADGVRSPSRARSRGSAHGARAVPGAWREKLHGWPGLDADGLSDLAVRAVRHGAAGRPDQPGTAG